MIQAPRAALFGPFRLVMSSKQLLKDGVAVPVGGRALELLIALVGRAGEVLTKEELLASAWPNLFVEEANLRVQMTALRRVLGDGQDGRRYIASIARRGYSFVAEVAFTDCPEPDSGLFRSIRQNLPLNLTPVLGRGATVEAIREYLARRRFVSVVGPGGVGKTTAALAAARDILGDDGPSGRDIAILVELAQISDAALVENAIASAISVTLGSGTVCLADPLPFEHGLLILDNCEQVLHAVAVLAERLLETNPNLHLLVTSREPLRARGEHVLRLQGLEVTLGKATDPGQDALSLPAPRLFVERAASTLGSYEPAPDDVALIVDICRRLDGLPLAIELAAGRVDAFGIHGLAQRLDDLFQLLVAGRRTALARHQTLQATLAWSYDHLSDAEQTTLCRLSVFAGYFSLDAASRVAAIREPSWEIIENLTSLISKSLITADFSLEVPRYRLLEVTRAYALEKLKQSGDLERISRRHAQHVRELLEEAGREWPRVRPADWLAIYGSQIDNARAALDWSFGPKGDRELGIAITLASAELWFQLSLVDECRARFERALASLGEGAPLNPSLEATLLSTLGTAHIYTVGPGPQAVELVQAAGRAAQRADDLELELRVGWASWLAEFCSGQYGPSLETARAFSQRAWRAGDDRREAHLVVANRLTGISLLFLGRVEEARTALESALRGNTTSNVVVRMQYDQELTGRAFYSMSLYLLGLQDQASALAARNTTDSYARGHATSLALNLVDSGCPVAFYCGEADALAGRLEMLADVSDRYGFGPWRAWCRCYRGSLHLLRGAHSQAVEDLTAGLHALERTLWPVRRAMFLGHRAEALGQAGFRKEALAGIEPAIASCQASGEDWILPELLRIRAELVAPQQMDEAMTSLDEGWSLAQRRNLRSWALRLAMAAVRLKPEEHQHKARLGMALAALSEGHAMSDYRNAQHLLGTASS